MAWQDEMPKLQILEMLCISSLVFACNCLKDIKEPDCNNSPSVTILHFYSAREDSRKWHYSKGMSKERGELNP